MENNNLSVTTTIVNENADQIFQEIKKIQHSANTTTTIAMEHNNLSVTTTIVIENEPQKTLIDHIHIIRESQFLIPLEVILLLAWLFMFLREITEILILYNESTTVRIFIAKYCNNIENCLEWLAMISVVLCGHLRHDLVDKSLGFGIVSLGICAAWLQLIFVLASLATPSSVTSL